MTVPGATPGTLGPRIQRLPDVKPPCLIRPESFGSGLFFILLNSLGAHRGHTATVSRAIYPVSALSQRRPKRHPPQADPTPRGHPARGAPAPATLTNRMTGASTFHKLLFAALSECSVSSVGACWRMAQNLPRRETGVSALLPSRTGRRRHETGVSALLPSRTGS